jgi:hypothetical protein
VAGAPAAAPAATSLPPVDDSDPFGITTPPAAQPGPTPGNAATPPAGPAGAPGQPGDAFDPFR